jgi:serine/threonine protein kinase
MASKHTQDFQLLERRDSGLYGVVWRARQLQLNRDVAVKFIRASMVAVKNAVEHARALARVNHPNVVTVHQVAKIPDHDGGEPVDCVVMEWLEGTKLVDQLNSKPFSFVHAVTLCRSLLDGLEAIHAAGIAHGDLHAGNVLLIGDRLKIIDIDYSESQTLARLSVSSRETHILGDVEFARFLARRVIFHSNARPSVLDIAESKLMVANTINEIRTTLAEMEQVQAKPKPEQGASAKRPEATDGAWYRGKSLSGDAVLLLIAASNDQDGMIVFSEALDGAYIQSNGKQFLEKGNPRERARWTRILEQLCDLGLIERNAINDGFQSYRLTDNGFEFVDRNQR